MRHTLGRARVAWASPRVQRVRSVASWLVLIGLVILVVRRYVPDYTLLDLGPAPAMVYASLDGGTIELADFEGQVVVVNVWATWCPPCVIETPGFVDLQAEFSGDVQFLGVSVDEDMAAIQSFVERYEVDYPVLIGPNLVEAALDVTMLPTTYVIDRNGRVRMMHAGLLVEPALRPILRALVRDEASAALLPSLPSSPQAARR